MAEGRERARFLGAVALILVGLAASYWFLLGREVAPVAVAPPAAVAADTDKLVLSRVEGPVRIRRSDADGGWIEARTGDALKADDLIETGPGATAQLSAGERYQVNLDANAQFAVREINESIARFRLDFGLMNASVKDDPARAFEVESGDDVVTRTRGGDLAVTHNGKGVVSVGVSRGSAELSSGGKVVALRSGQQSLAIAGRPPSTPSPIAKSLLLKVVWPRETLVNKRRIVVSGQTTPGAVLAVVGRPITVDAEGRFRQEVVLKDGQHSLTIVGQDVGGRRVEEKGPEVLVDTRGAAAEFETQDLWGGQTK
jgi:hypothetical protein